MAPTPTLTPAPARRHSASLARASRRAEAIGCHYEHLGRLTVTATPALTALVLSRSLVDVFSTPKVLVVAMGGFVLLGLAAVAATRGHRLALPWGPALWGALAFVAVAGMATIFSPSPLRSFGGASGARSGLLLYLACVVLFVAAATLYRGRSPAGVVAGLLGAAVPVLIYGTVQALGHDPLRWRSNAGGPLIFATFGNANFFSAWAGVLSILAVWGAVSRTWGTRRRLACGLFAGAAFALMLTSQSIQGPLAAVAGLAVLAAARVSDRGRHASRLRRRTLLFFALPVVSAGAVAAILATRGDAAGSIASRVGKWQAALAMGRARPLTGFGFDLFGDWYHAYRPASDALARGLAHTADAAHSVVLQLLAGGGIPLLAAYLFFLGAVATLGVRALRPAQGERRLLIGAVLGAWAAYQVQALVSIDVAGLAVLHWLLAGLLVALASEAPPDTRHRRHRPWRPREALAVTVATCLVLGLFTVPIRAEMAARRATRFALQQRHASVERAFGIALRLNPWEPRYAVALARERLHRGDERLALEAYELAAARSPRDMVVALEHARAAARSGPPDEAARRYDAAMQLDPRSPHLKVEAARHALQAGDNTTALRLLEEAVAADDRAGWRRLLEQARRRGG